MTTLRYLDVATPQMVDVGQVPEGLAGRYWAWPLSLTVAPGTETVFEVSWPIPVAVQLVSIMVPSGAEGDELRRAAVKVGIVGQVAQVVDATRLVVGTPAPLARGVFLTFPTRDPAGEYFVQDAQAQPDGLLAIELSSGGPIGAPAALPSGLAPGDPVGLVVRLVPIPIRIDLAGVVVRLGLGSLRSMLVPAGAVFQAVWRNNGTVTRNVSGLAELYY